MSPFHFPFRNINDATTSALCFVVSLVAFTGKKVSRTCSWVSSFVTAALSHSLNLFIPVLSAYCVMTIWSMWSPLSSSVMSVLRWICPLSWFLPSMVGISLVTFSLFLVGYLPYCSDTGSYSSSYMTFSSSLSSSSLYISIRSGIYSSYGYNSSASSFSSSYSS